MKLFLVALISAFMTTPATSIEDVMEQTKIEEIACHDVCDESYQGSKYEKSGMPIWFYRKACLPRCLEGMRCVEEELQWVCTYLESRKT